jgi:hypothetical protein
MNGGVIQLLRGSTALGARTVVGPLLVSFALIINFHTGYSRQAYDGLLV